MLKVLIPVSSYVARFVSRKNLRDHHLDEVDKAFGPVKQMLDGFRIPYSAHAELGERAKTITDAA